MSMQHNDMHDYTEKAEKALLLAKKYAKKLKQGYIGCEHILLGLMKEDTGVAANVLREHDITEKKVLELVKELIAFEAELSTKEIYSPRARHILRVAGDFSRRCRVQKIGTEHLLLALIKESGNVAVRILHTLNVNIDKLYFDILIAIGENPNDYSEELHGSGQDVELTIDKYSVDLTQKAYDGLLDPVIGREAEIARTIQILSRRTKNNPCFIGEPGVGKTAVVEALAQKIVAGEVPDTVRNKRVLTLDLSAMVAGSKYRGEFEERIKKVMEEVKADSNIILFLDELHTIIGAGGAEGAMDASNILKPALSRGEIQLIGATTITEYRKYIEKDAALERRFQPIYVEEPTKEEAIRILEGVAYKYEEHHNVKITKEAIECAVTLSTRYINDRYLPDKAIDLIDEAASAARIMEVDKPLKLKLMEEACADKEKALEDALREGDIALASKIRTEQEVLLAKITKLQAKYEKGVNLQQIVIGEDEIAYVVSTWTKIPVIKLTEKESERLMNLESILHKRVISQNQAVDAVAKAIRRGRVGLKDPKRPIGSFLFLGPTGVGKTELSKALSESVFGDEKSLIRVDMSEYMEGHAVSKLIGSPPGYVGFEDGGQLSEKVRRNPYSVVLFDEIEKAHPDVFNVLLQILDDGHITDSKGRVVSFKNTIIILTSNAGANRIVDPKNLGFSSKTDAQKDFEKMKSGVMEEVKRIFKPEFINRIDEIIVFKQLTKLDMKDVVTLLIKELSTRCEEQKGMKLTVTPTLKEHLVEKYSDLKMGARPLRRAIQTVIEDGLAQEILSGKIGSNQQVIVGFSAGKVTFKVKA
ncbi:MAG: ATP-dependent Clp protease ATP-binding subunit [Lachnospiraceae bacterium]